MAIHVRVVTARKTDEKRGEKYPTKLEKLTGNLQINRMMKAMISARIRNRMIHHL